MVSDFGHRPYLVPCVILSYLRRIHLLIFVSRGVRKTQRDRSLDRDLNG